MTPKGRGALLVRLICLGSALLWIVLVAADRGLLERFELAALDTELRLGPHSHASPDIIIVAVDERAVHRYGPLRWPPSRMAEIITALDRATPRVIAFDFAFSAEGEAHERGAAAGRPELQPLREAAKRSGKVVLGNYFDFDADPDGPPLPPDSGFREHRVRRLLYLGGARPATAAPPVPAASEVHTLAPGLPAAARAYGHLNLVPGGDGIIRAMPLVARYQDDFYSGFAVEVACVYLSDVGKDTEGEIRPEVLIGRQRVEGLRLGDHRITTDERGQLLLRFAGGRGSYATYSVADVLAGRISVEQIRGRIVLIGSTAAGAADVWATPFDPLLLWLLGHYLLFTRTGYALSVVSPLFAMVTLLGGTLVVSYFTEEKKRQQLERSFEHYLDRSVISELLERPELLRLGGERRDLTVLFCDIRNFTTLAEGLPPEATVEMLNEFFTTMTGVVFSNGGLVDKFVGDQIMAIWGAPLERQDHAVQGCAAALGMIRAFDELRMRWAHLPVCPWDSSRRPSDPTPAGIQCGVGINSGPMVVGNIGSARRFSYTVIGDNVNVASRLEGVNKLYGTQILVGPDTYAAAREKVWF